MDLQTCISRSQAAHGAALALVLGAGLVACELSHPPAPTASKNPPAFLLKFSAYAKDGALVGFFTLGDTATNQVAASGRLRLQIYTSTVLGLAGSAGPAPSGGMKLKTTLYDNSFAIGATNFHWESFGSLLTVNDLACRFMVPYAHFKNPVRPGRMAAVDLEFTPDGGSNTFRSNRNVALY